MSDRLTDAALEELEDVALAGLAICAHERIAYVCADAHKGHLSMDEAHRRIHAASAALAGVADVADMTTAEVEALRWLRENVHLLHDYTGVDRRERSVVALDKILATNGGGVTGEHP